MTSLPAESFRNVSHFRIEAWSIWRRLEKASRASSPSRTEAGSSDVSTKRRDCCLFSVNLNLDQLIQPVSQPQPLFTAPLQTLRTPEIHRKAPTCHELDVAEVEDGGENPKRVGHVRVAEPRQVESVARDAEVVLVVDAGDLARAASEEVRKLEVKTGLLETLKQHFYLTALQPY